MSEAAAIVVFFAIITVVAGAVVAALARREIRHLKQELTRKEAELKTMEGLLHASRVAQASVSDAAVRPVRMRDVVVVATASTPPIVAANLLEASGGDTRIEQEILIGFRRSNREDAQRLRSSLDMQDPEAIQRTAHRMKGASRKVGALDLASVCEQLEHASRDREMEKVQQLWPRLFAELERLDRFLDGI